MGNAQDRAALALLGHLGASRAEPGAQ
jgi:hypothetical protein